MDNSMEPEPIATNEITGVVSYLYTVIVLIVGSGAGACPGIRKRGGPKSESLFFFFFFFFFFFLLFNFSGGGPAQKLAEKMIFSTKKVAKYR